MGTPQQEGNHIWYWKPSQLPRVNEVTEEGLTLTLYSTIIIPNCILNIYITHLCVFSTCVKHLLQHIETITKKILVKIQRERDHRISIPSWYIYNTIPASKACGGLKKRGQKNCSKRQMNRKSSVRLSPEITSYTNSSSAIWLRNRTWTMAITIGMWT